MMNIRYIAFGELTVYIDSFKKMMSNSIYDRFILSYLESDHITFDNILSINPDIINTNIADVIFSKLTIHIAKADSKDVCTIFHIYSSYSSISDEMFEVVKKYIRFYRHVDSTDRFGNNPLIVACFNGDVKLIDLFSNMVSDINHVNKYGSAAIHAVNRVGSGFYKAVDILISRGADINFESWNGNNLISEMFLNPNISDRDLISRMEYLISLGIKGRLRIRNLNNISKFRFLYIKDLLENDIITDIDNESLKVILTHRNSLPIIHTVIEKFSINQEIMSHIITSYNSKLIRYFIYRLCTIANILEPGSIDDSFKDKLNLASMGIRNNIINIIRYKLSCL